MMAWHLQGRGGRQGGLHADPRVATSLTHEAVGFLSGWPGRDPRASDHAPPPHRETSKPCWLGEQSAPKGSRSKEQWTG